MNAENKAISAHNLRYAGRSNLAEQFGTHLNIMYPYL